MLSGIGRPNELAALQIPLVAEVPGVGRNLIDHPGSGVIYLSDHPDSLFGALNEHNLEVFQANSRGPLTSNVAEAGGFMRTSDGLDAPDVQFHLAPALFIQEGLVPGQAHGFTLGAGVTKPHSRGQITLVSPEPTTKPLITHNYYSDPQDLQTQIAGMRLAMHIANTAPLAKWASHPHLAPDSDSDITAHIRATMQTLYHPVGTCKMGTDDMAVVDPQLRVHSLEGLRVVDASIMPTIPRGNTNAPTIAVAEQAADLIRGLTPPRRQRLADAPSHH